MIRQFPFGSGREAVEGMPALLLAGELPDRAAAESVLRGWWPSPMVLRAVAERVGAVRAERRAAGVEVPSLDGLWQVECQLESLLGIAEVWAAAEDVLPMVRRCGVGLGERAQVVAEMELLVVGRGHSPFVLLEVASRLSPFGELERVPGMREFVDGLLWWEWSPVGMPEFLGWDAILGAAPGEGVVL